MIQNAINLITLYYLERYQVGIDDAAEDFLREQLDKVFMAGKEAGVTEEKHNQLFNIQLN